MAILKKTSALIAAGLTAATSISGCETIERETGLSRDAQTGAGVGAATGGLIALLADANPGWIIASALLGGVAGGVIGEHINRRDAEMHASNNYDALQNLGAGETSNWSNDETGHSGYTTVTNVYTGPDGRTCKDFTEVVETPERTFSEDGTACRTADGGWETT